LAQSENSTQTSASVRQGAKSNKPEGNKRIENPKSKMVYQIAKQKKATEQMKLQA
jgi:hypothetical protein